jgi:protein-tyrosine-phosphatase
MRVLLNGATREDPDGSQMDEFRDQMRNLDKKIEQLAAEITI